jgi:two-component system NtrC family sensor kinase
MNSIADILTQLSTFSKIPPMELKPSKVNSLIEESLSLIQYDKRTQDITIIKDLASDIPMITTDASQLSHVLVNMALNAADAMPNGNSDYTSRTRNKSVEIDFEDTGSALTMTISTGYSIRYLLQRRRDRWAGVSYHY